MAKAEGKEWEGRVDDERARMSALWSSPGRTHDVVLPALAPIPPSPLRVLLPCSSSSESLAHSQPINPLTRAAKPSDARPWTTERARRRRKEERKKGRIRTSLQTQANTKAEVSYACLSLCLYAVWGRTMLNLRWLATNGTGGAQVSQGERSRAAGQKTQTSPRQKPRNEPKQSDPKHTGNPKRLGTAASRARHAANRP